MIKICLRPLFWLILVAVAASNLWLLERELQRREIFRLVTTISPETAYIRNFASDGWLLFGRPASYWIVDCASRTAAVPAGASIAHENDRKYMLEEFGRQFSGRAVPLGNEQVWVMDSPEGEVAICLSADSKLMWIWRLGQ